MEKDKIIVGYIKTDPSVVLEMLAIQQASKVETKDIDGYSGYVHGWQHGYTYRLNKTEDYDKLKEENEALKVGKKEMLDALESGRQFIIDNIDNLPNSHDIRLKMLRAINNNQ